MDPRVQHWLRVPDRSKLRITAIGTVAKQTVDGRVDWLDSDNNGTTLPLDTANGKATDVLLRSPRGYSVDVILTFQTDATATVAAQVLKPDGQLHGKPYSATIAGTKGKVEFVSLFLLTKQS